MSFSRHSGADIARQIRPMPRRVVMPHTRVHSSTRAAFVAAFLPILGLALALSWRGATLLPADGRTVFLGLFVTGFVVAARHAARPKFSTRVTAVPRNEIGRILEMRRCCIQHTLEFAMIAVGMIAAAILAAAALGLPAAWLPAPAALPVLFVVLCVLGWLVIVASVGGHRTIRRALDLALDLRP
jgi:hypothetical protein